MMMTGTEFRFLMVLILIILSVITCAAKIEHENRANHKPATTPLSEVRCSDLERVINECEAADDVALCRGRYDVKIAMCFRGQ